MPDAEGRIELTLATDATSPLQAVDTMVYITHRALRAAGLSESYVAGVELEAVPRLELVS
jgi:hypothetical protein